MNLVGRVAGIGLLLGLAACTQGGAGAVDNGNEAPTPLSCKDDFRPERVAAGENCDPGLNRARFCHLMSGTDILRSHSEVIACAGVDVSTQQAAGGGFITNYLAIRPAAGRQPKAVYLALHFLNADTHYFANLTRMSELAAARDVLVLVPQAPNNGIGVTDQIGLPLPPDRGLLSRWPNTVQQAVDSNLLLLDSVVRDARSRYDAADAPLYVAGLSNGVPMAYFYACRRADQVEAMLSVAGSQNTASAQICRPSRPVGLVIVHGTLDPLVPYDGQLGALNSAQENFRQFKQHDRCTGADGNAMLVANRASVSLDYAPSCADGRRVVLASALENGHNWPGDDTNVLQENGVGLGLLGPARDGIDSTIQGYDLLRYAAGY